MSYSNPSAPTRIFPFEKDKYNWDESVPPSSHPLYNM